MKIAFAIAAAAIAAAAPAAAARQDAGVAYSDLDLGTRAGAAELDRRIARAAEKKCGKVRDGDIAFARPVRACQKQESARVRAAIAAASGAD